MGGREKGEGREGGREGWRKEGGEREEEVREVMPQLHKYTTTVLPDFCLSSKPFWVLVWVWVQEVER